MIYKYDDVFRSILFNYKGNYDYALRKVFLTPFRNLIQLIYKDYVIIPIPSTSTSNEIRGFLPMYSIAITVGLPVINCLYKVGDYKQSDEPFKTKYRIKEYLRIKDVNLKGKKILILDDVITSSNTIQAAIKLVELSQPKQIKVLILAKR